MRRKRRGFDPVRFARSLERQLVIGIFLVLYLVGGGLIWLFYGKAAALLGMVCMTGGLFFFLL
ncbi:MAG: hypothetical protein NT075_28955, partial [Chloroflexi bacterium]|nr:hypothetical protein [Chloroflexota bacterium]